MFGGMKHDVMDCDMDEDYFRDAATPGSPATVCHFGEDMDCDLGTGSGAGDFPEWAVAPPRFSWVGRLSQPPALRDYVME